MSIVQREYGSDIRLGLTLTTFGSLLFTLDLPLLRLAKVDLWTLVFARGVAIFWALSVAWSIMRIVRADGQPYLAGRTGTAVAVSNMLAPIFYISAIFYTAAANVVFAMALIPVMTAVLSRAFLGERIQGWTWLAVMLSFSGVSIIVWDSAQAGTWFGDLLALLSALCTAASFTIVRASRKNVTSSLALGSLASAVVALVFCGAAPISLLNAGAFGYSALFWVALNGLVAMPLATAMIANGPRFLPAADVGMFFLLETILAPVWIWLLFGEIPSAFTLLGGMIVIGTLLLHSGWRLATSLQTRPGFAE